MLTLVTWAVALSAPSNWDRQAAPRFEVGVSSAIRWSAQLRKLDDMAPKPRGGPRRLRSIGSHRAIIMEWIDAEPDLTLLEIAGKLEAAVGHGPPGIDGPPPNVVH